MSKGWSNDEIAARIAVDLPEHAIVNLGIGLPILVANHIPEGKTIFFHSENGIIGLGPVPAPGQEDPTSSMPPRSTPRSSRALPSCTMRTRFR